MPPRRLLDDTRHLPIMVALRRFACPVSPAWRPAVRPSWHASSEMGARNDGRVVMPCLHLDLNDVGGQGVWTIPAGQAGQ